MAGVTASLALLLSARLTGAAVGSGTPQFTAEVEHNLEFVPGTGAVNQLDVLYQATRTIAASGNEDLDFAGVLANALGATIAAAEIVAIVVEAAAGNTNNVRFGPAASAGALGPFMDATDRLSLTPGDFHLLTCRNGWAITATTADKWNFANSAGGSGVTYTITVLGRTVAA